MREEATRARRLAWGLSIDDDRDALARYAEELDGKAAQLEQVAGCPAPNPSRHPH